MKKEPTLAAKQLLQLLVLGIINLISGLFLYYSLLRTSNAYLLIYLPLHLVSLIAGYIAVACLDKGGRVNYYRDKNMQTQEDIQLNDFVIKYRNSTLITITLIVMLGLSSYCMLRFHKIHGYFDPNEFVLFLLLPFIIFLLVGTGLKYVSTWWKIYTLSKQ